MAAPFLNMAIKKQYIGSIAYGGVSNNEVRVVPENEHLLRRYGLYQYLEPDAPVKASKETKSAIKKKAQMPKKKKGSNKKKNDSSTERSGQHADSDAKGESDAEQS